MAERTPWQRALLDLDSGQVRTPSMLPPGSELVYAIDIAASTKTLVLTVMERRPKKDGTFSRPQPMEIERWHADGAPTPADREIIGVLAALDVRSATNRKRLDLPPVVAELLLPRITATGRAFADEHPLPAMTEQHLERRLRVVRRKGAYELQVDLLLDGATLDASGVTLITSNAFAYIDGALVRVTPVSGKLVDSLQQRGPVTVPAGDRDVLARALYVHGPRSFDAPDELRAERVDGIPVTVAFITAQDPTAVEAEIGFRYGDVTVPAHRGDSYITRDERSYVVERNRAAERASFEAIGELFGSWDGSKPVRFHPYELPTIVRRLLSIGVEVLANRKRARTARALSTSVASGVDWFELQGEATFEAGDDVTTASLQTVMDAIATRSPYIVLDDGSLGLLPEEWLTRYAGLARAVALTSDGKRFARSRAAVLDVLLARLENVAVDDVFAKARGELRDFRGVEPAKPSKRFRGALRPYQLHGLGWLLTLDQLDFHGCLADEMGLGKTVQVLSWLVTRKAHDAPSLVVAPRSVVHNWVNEAKKFAPSLSVYAHIDGNRERGLEGLAKHDLVVTSYGTLTRDIGLLGQQPFDVVVLDEAQVIKNESTVTAKAARTLRARRRLALSGTPIENHLGELWSIFEFLSPGLLGTPAFQRALEADARRPDPAIRQLVSDVVRPFILRRTKNAVATDLPEKQEQTILVEMGEQQRAIYETLRVRYRDEVFAAVHATGLAKSKLHVLEGLLRLRQAACHPGLIADEFAAADSAKLETFFAMLTDVVTSEGKVLVFSQFTSLLALVRSELETRGVKHTYLDGQTRDRAAVVDEFQNDATCRVMLVSLKAGGTGLNLTAADYVFILDPWWNPAAEAQAIDRAHRIGRTRPVFAYKLVAKDTVEERILELQRDKAALAESILGGKGATLRGMTQADLEALFA